MTTYGSAKALNLFVLPIAFINRNSMLELMSGKISQAMIYSRSSISYAESENWQSIYCQEQMLRMNVALEQINAILHEVQKNKDGRAKKSEVSKLVAILKEVKVKEEQRDAVSKVFENSLISPANQRREWHETLLQQIDADRREKEKAKKEEKTKKEKEEKEKGDK